MEQETNSKTDQTKKWLSMLVLILMGAALIETVVLAFMPIISVNGTQYSGWKIAFYYWGKQYIYNYHEFGFNFILASSIVVTFIAIIFSLIKWRKWHGFKRSILQFVVAAFLIYCGVAFLNALPLAEKTASTTMFKTIYYAKNSHSYLLTSYASVNFVICIVIAVIQIASGIFNIKQKKDN